MTGWAPRFATRLAFSFVRTRAVTSWPARTSASSTAPPTCPVAPVRKIRIAGVYHNSVVARDTLVDFFHDLALARGDFLVYDDGFRSHTLTYRDVGQQAQRFAARLHTIGLQKGDAVVFWSENRPEWIIAFWGCLLRGIVVVPIDYRASPDFLRRVSHIVSARLIVIGQEVPPFDARDAPVWKLHELQWIDGPAETGDGGSADPVIG